MELPTYTNIWKIEKRLYKLYDFRLPMPLPIGQVTVFLAIAVPYMLVLTLAGMPFSHTWVWLYVLPPGLMAWLITRPVLEGKRLPELVLSQVRYLAEPRAWCRLAAVAEKDRIIVVARVWRGPASPGLAGGTGLAARTGLPAEAVLSGDAATRGDVASSADAESDRQPGNLAQAASYPAHAASYPAQAVRPAWPHRPAVGQRGQDRVAVASGETSMSTGAVPGLEPPTSGAGAATPDPSVAAEVGATAADARPAPGVPIAGARARARASDGLRQPSASTPRHSPDAGQRAVTVQAGSAADQPLHVVERALRTSPARTGTGWRDRVVVVPGGHRPGKPDHVQRDQARARLPLPGPARIVVLGSTAGAGQTVTTLLTGQLLARLRGESVAVLDLSAGASSLTTLARQIPRLLPGSQPRVGIEGRSGPGRDRVLQVVTAEHAGSEPRDADRLIDAVCARYPLTIADPSAADVPRALQAADQLVLVSPAGADAAGSLAMTLEWLEMHGHARLVQAAVTVLNGVSSQTTEHAERAAGVVVGRCRAVVRVPWDARLSEGGALAVETVRAYTALAGVLIAGLAESRPHDAAVGPAAVGPAAVGPASAGRVSP